MRMLALTRYGRLGASSRLRTIQFLPMLRARGIDGLVRPLFSDEMLLAKYQSSRYSLYSLLKAYACRVKYLFLWHQFDLIWIEKEALPWLPLLCERLLLRRAPYVLDYDDAIFHKYDLHRLYWVRRLWGQRIDRLMAGARLVVAGNEYLAQRARDAGAIWVEVVPTVVDLARYAPRQVSRQMSGCPQIVWIGSPSTVKYLAALKAPLKELAARIPFKLCVIGGVLRIEGVDVECLPWTEESEVELIAECDIGIMPLTDSPWERGKCGYKLIQYMACGLPVVASPVGVNTEMVKDGVNGFLVGSIEGWVEKLESLLRDSNLRRFMGANGRRGVEEYYSLDRVGPKLATLLEKARQN